MDKNETNEKKSGENLGVPEYQIQTQKNIIEHENDNVQEAQIDSSYVPITKELVYGYVAETIDIIGWNAALE